ncbi:MAG: hypothetical protein H7315_06535 [Herminiimonas sp.]|nr:hypothetical protein [Herminiimonas sp.]
MACSTNAQRTAMLLRAHHFFCHCVHVLAAAAIRSGRFAPGGEVQTGFQHRKAGKIVSESSLHGEAFPALGRHSSIAAPGFHRIYRRTENGFTVFSL